jgi:hypothetical protein
MVETVDAQCELPQAQLFDSLGGAEIASHPDTEIFKAT